MAKRVDDVLDCETITDVIGHAGEKVVLAYLESEIIKLAASLNVNEALNLKRHQVPMIAAQLIEDYRWESLEDFVICFRRGSAGKYGEIFRLDGAIIGQWMARYLDEKYEALERRKQAEKKLTRERQLGESVDSSKWIAEWLRQVGAPDQKDADNAKENEYQRTKLSYQSPPDDVVRQRELHIIYLRENYDAKTGKQKAGWLPESEWTEQYLKANE